MKKRKTRYSKRKRSGNEILQAVLIVCLSALVLVLIGAIGMNLRNRGSGQPEANRQTTTTEQNQQETGNMTTEDTGVSNDPIDTTQPDNKLPYLLEDGKLEISSLFQYTGLNPDAYWEEGANTGAVILTNCSEEYLTSLNLTVTMSDGSILKFWIQDLPAGKTVWAYEVENTAYSLGAVIQDVQCTSEYAPSAGIPRDQVAVSISGMDVTLTNQSDSDLDALEIRCHNVVNGAYFGGIAYVYPVEKLRVQEKVTVTAYDCFLGELDVSLIDYEN